MHELSIVEEMLTVALDRAAQANAAQIAQFNIEMSAWANESEESLRFCFENLTRGTIAQKARLQIQRVPARGVCADCGRAFESESTYGECPACHSFRVRAIRGNDLRLIGIEVN